MIHAAVNDATVDGGCYYRWMMLLSMMDAPVNDATVYDANYFET